MMHSTCFKICFYFIVFMCCALVLVTRFICLSFYALFTFKGQINEKANKSGASGDSTQTCRCSREH